MDTNTKNVGHPATVAFALIIATALSPVAANAQHPCDSILRVPSSSISWDYSLTDKQNLFRLLSSAEFFESARRTGGGIDMIIDGQPLGMDWRNEGHRTSLRQRLELWDENRLQAIAQHLRTTWFPTEAVSAWRQCMEKYALTPWPEVHCFPSSVQPGVDPVPGTLHVTIHHVHYQVAEVRPEGSYGFGANHNLQLLARMPDRVGHPATALSFTVKDRRKEAWLGIATTLGVLHIYVPPATVERVDEPPRVVRLSVRQDAAPRRQVTARADDMPVIVNYVDVVFSKPVLSAKAWLLHDDAPSSRLRQAAIGNARTGIRNELALSQDRLHASGHMALVFTSHPQANTWRGFRSFLIEWQHPGTGVVETASTVVERQD